MAPGQHRLFRYIDGTSCVHSLLAVPREVMTRQDAGDLMHLSFCVTHAGAGQDPVAALLYCTPSIRAVDLSVINGHIVVKDGQLQTLDLQVRMHTPYSSI